MTALKGRRALVTGASGFIGAALCRALQAAGASVHGVSRGARHGGGCDQWWRSDLTDLGDVRRVVRGAQPDLIFHLASHVAGGRALDMVPSTFQANLTPSVNLLTAATEIGGARFLLTGSMEEPAPDGDWPIPSSPYAAAKYAASTYARMFHQLYQTPVTLLRLFMVYGPGQVDVRKLIPHVIISLLAGRAPDLSSGRRLVDWIYVDDAVRAYLMAAVADKLAGKTLDIGSGNPVAVRTVVERLRELMQSPVAPRFDAIPERPFEQERVANVGATVLALDWQPQVELDQGLAQTIDWYRARFPGSELKTQAGR